MKQKLALAAALLTRPDLLLLDEPTTGVDPLSRREFWRLLHELNHDGLTIVVSTPYMDEAEYASRLGFLDEGRLTSVGTRADILATFRRQLVEVRTADRLIARSRLRTLADVDDVSLFGTVLHVRAPRGRGTRPRLARAHGTAGPPAPAGRSRHLAFARGRVRPPQRARGRMIRMGTVHVRQHSATVSTIPGRDSSRSR